MIAVSAYYKSLTFATIGQAPAHAPTLDRLDSKDAVDAFGGEESFQAAGTPSFQPKNKEIHFGNDTIRVEIVFERFDKCVRGIFNVGPLVAEIIGWGDAEELAESKSWYMDLGYASLRALHDARETRVLINSHDSGTVYINFFLNDVVTAQGYIHDTNNSPLSVSVNGTYTWE